MLNFINLMVLMAALCCSVKSTRPLLELLWESALSTSMSTDVSLFTSLWDLFFIELPNLSHTFSTKFSKLLGAVWPFLHEWMSFWLAFLVNRCRNVVFRPFLELNGLVELPAWNHFSLNSFFVDSDEVDGCSLIIARARAARYGCHVATEVDFR